MVVRQIQILHESGKVGDSRGLQSPPLDVPWSRLLGQSELSPHSEVFRSPSWLFLALLQRIPEGQNRPRRVPSPRQSLARIAYADALRPAGARGVASLMVSFIVCPIVFLKTSFLACKKGHDGRRTKLSQKSTPYPLMSRTHHLSQFAERRHLNIIGIKIIETRVELG